MSEQDHFLVPPPAGQKRRRRRARPLSEQAQARLAAATSELPERGDRITIRWPGGPHDFVMVFEGED
ncbi:MAG TPA: hypothetical protein VHK64_08470, partial [Nocardioidaceae bacterium]|nr:hypothetical protein [Nocardioidaceae bacterium]